jgi:hypothetical protein
MAGKRKRTYEGSKADIAEDKRGARRLKMSLKQYERTAKDKAEDKRGQVRFEKVKS